MRWWACIYRADWEPAATSGKSMAGVPGVVVSRHRGRNSGVVPVNGAPRCGPLASFCLKRALGAEVNRFPDLTSVVLWGWVAPRTPGRHCRSR